MSGDDEAIRAVEEGVAVTLQEMAGLEVAFRDRRPASEGEFTGVRVLLTIRNQETGYLALACPPPVAAALTRRVLSELHAEPDDAMIRDCLGEVLNVIAGQVKTRLLGTAYHFMLATPTFDIDALPEAERERWLLPVATEIGEFFVHVRLPVGNA